MPKNTILIDQKFYSEFKNGVGFTDNLLDFTRNLTGSVGEKVKVITRISIDWKSDYSTPDPRDFEWVVFLTNGDLTIRRTDGGNFIEDGFAIGQMVRVRALFGSAASPFVEYNGKMLEILEKEIVINIGVLGALPSDILFIQVLGIEPITALINNFGLIENRENFNTISKVTQETTGYYGIDLGVDINGSRDTSFKTMQKLGKHEDFVTGTMKARFVENDVDRYNFKQIFEIDHEFIINPLFVEEQQTEFVNRVAPEYLIGEESLKYVFNAEFRQVLNNPNISYAYKQDDLLGSVAWFDESFNGFNNSYKIDSIGYKDNGTGDNADGILIDGVTRINISVSKKVGSFVAGDRFGVYSYILAKESEYIGTTETNMLQNFIYDRVLGIQDANTFNGSDYIKTMTSTLNAGVLEIELTFEYDTEQKKRIAELNANNKDFYFIGVQVGDNSLNSGNSDRVILIGDINNFDQSADISGLLEIENYEVFPPNEDINTGQSFTDYCGWPEDGIIIKKDLKVNVERKASINSASIVLMAYNPITKVNFLLDERPLQLNSVIQNGVQQIEIDETRGYNLKGENEFNLVQFKNKSSDAFFNIYEVVFGQKLGWQDWIENLDVDSVFYNTNKPNNNRNLKSSNYSELEGYEIRSGLLMNLFGFSELGTSGDTDYLVIGPKIIVLDYEVGVADPPQWSASIQTFRELNNESLGGAVLTSENTIMQTVWTNLTPVTDITDLFAFHRIEETNQPGVDIDELSNIFAPPENNRLIPLVGESLLKIELNAGTVVTTCLIDSSKLDSNKQYNLTARIGGGGAVVENFKVTSPLNEIKDTSGTVESKIVSE